MWMNDNAGILVLILGIVIIVILAVILCLEISLRGRFTSQRLKFIGLYATDVATRQVYASLTIGNRSVSEIVIKEIGIKNGRVAFDLTPLYRAKLGMDARTRIVIEQRHSIDFSVSVSELEGVLVDGKNGKQLRTLRLYAVDLMGNLYQGRIDAVRKLLSDVMAGKASAAPAATASASPAAAAGAEKTRPAQTAPVQTAPAQSSAAPAPAPVPIREFGKDTAARKLVVGPVATPETREKTEALRPEDLFRKP